MNISAVLDDFFCKESLGLDKIKYSHVNLNEKKHPRPVQKKKKSIFNVHFHDGYVGTDTF